MKLKEISKGIGLTLTTWTVVVGILLLANHGSLAIMSRQMATLVRLLMAVAFVASAAYGLYRAFICPVIYLVKAWRRGERLLVALCATLCLLVAACLVELGHWSRVPEYDSVSSCGKYKLVFYSNNYDLTFILPAGPGDGLFREAKVELVKTSSGEVIDSKDVDSLTEALNVTWLDDVVWAGRGDGSAELRLRKEGDSQ